MTKQDQSKLFITNQNLVESGNTSKKFFINYQKVFQDIVHLMNGDITSKQDKGSREKYIDVKIGDFEFRIIKDNDNVKFATNLVERRTSDYIFSKLSEKSIEHFNSIDHLIISTDKQRFAATQLEKDHLDNYKQDHEKILKQVEYYKSLYSELLEENQKKTKTKRSQHDKLHEAIGSKPEAPKSNTLTFVVTTILCVIVIGVYHFMTR